MKKQIRNGLLLILFTLSIGALYSYSHTARQDGDTAESYTAYAAMGAYPDFTGDKCGSGTSGESKCGSSGSSEQKKKEEKKGENGEESKKASGEKKEKKSESNEEGKKEAKESKCGTGKCGVE